MHVPHDPFSLSEVELDLHSYRNLAEFFNRSLKSGSRPLDSDQHAILSPADAKVLQFGIIESGTLEQVKGVTYSLDALIGTEDPNHAKKAPNIEVRSQNEAEISEENLAKDEEFARINSISYTIPSLFFGRRNQTPSKNMDVSMTSKPGSEAEVRADLALGDGSRSSWFKPKDKPQTALYYIVFYLAPGDYHHFHSPVSWVVEKRRHFSGELFSVSNFIQTRLPGLFTINERVVLLGRWRYGLCSLAAIGATNVGSIRINFDKELKTNSLVTETAADRADEEAKEKGLPHSSYAEATYSEASKILGGHALKRGEEMGSFCLGSSIVLVFEGPIGKRKSFDEGWDEARAGGWRWGVEKGQKVKYGQAIGWYEEESR